MKKIVPFLLILTLVGTFALSSCQTSDDGMMKEDTMMEDDDMKNDDGMMKDDKSMG